MKHRLEEARSITMRHEEKYICSDKYLRILESRLGAVLESDKNQGEDGYEVKSVYFDTASDRFYEEGLEGLGYRDKYRIRIYNGSMDVIKLEKKTSICNLKKKKTAILKEKLVNRLLADGECLNVLDYENGSLMSEFARLQKTDFLQPKAVVRYNRKAFVSEIGNVRITLDRDISVTDKVTEFSKRDAVMFPVLPENMHLLEVKYDGILPGYLVRLMNFADLERSSFSKYILGREVLNENGRMGRGSEF